MRQFKRTGILPPISGIRSAKGTELISSFVLGHNIIINDCLLVVNKVFMSVIFL